MRSPSNLSHLVYSITIAWINAKPNPQSHKVSSTMPGLSLQRFSSPACWSISGRASSVGENSFPSPSLYHIKARSSDPPPINVPAPAGGFQASWPLVPVACSLRNSEEGPDQANKSAMRTAFPQGFCEGVQSVDAMYSLGFYRIIFRHVDFKKEQV